MIESLYGTFKYWSEDGSIWIISDLHFNDPDCQLMDSNWVSPEEQIRRINCLCGKNDTFICLGDVGDISYVSKLNAKNKVLIKGNHDSGNSIYQRKLTFFEKTNPNFEDREQAKKLLSQNRLSKSSKTRDTSWYHRRIDGEEVEHLRIQLDNGLFDEVYSGPLFISDRIVLSHSPLNFDKEFNCFFNIHGHEHSLVPRLNHLNVAANNIDYYPLNLGEIIKGGKLSNIDNINKFITSTAVEKAIEKNQEHNVRR